MTCPGLARCEAAPSARAARREHRASEPGPRSAPPALLRSASCCSPASRRRFTSLKECEICPSLKLVRTSGCPAGRAIAWRCVADEGRQHGRRAAALPCETCDLADAGGECQFCRVCVSGALGGKTHRSSLTGNQQQCRCAPG